MPEHEQDRITPRSEALSGGQGDLLIPVLCDCCRAEGVAGEGDFSDLRDLLDFEPVPRKQERADGWTAEVQRMFIVALAATGSERQAAHAVGKAAYGVTQLKKAEGGESFASACAAAKAIFAENRSRQLAAGIEAAAAAAQWRAKPPAWSGAATRRGRPGAYRPASVQPAPPPDEKRQAELKREAIANLLHKYAIKIGAERRCRLEGRIVEADFYVRQICWFETALELFSGDLLKLFEEFRHCGLRLNQLAASPGMLLLDKIRREQWEKMGEPRRPEHPPLRLCEPLPDGCLTEPLECTWSDHELSHEQQQAVFEERHRQDAEAQLLWEAEALAEVEAWRARVEGDENPPLNGERDQP